MDKRAAFNEIIYNRRYQHQQEHGTAPWFMFTHFLFRSLSLCLCCGTRLFRLVLFQIERKFRNGFLPFCKYDSVCWRHQISVSPIHKNALNEKKNITTKAEYGTAQMKKERPFNADTSFTFTHIHRVHIFLDISSLQMFVEFKSARQ